MSAAFGVQANPVTGTDVLRYWYTSDDGDGPSPTRWSTHLKIAWANKGGDFVDAKGVAQGSTPFVSQPVAAPGNVVVVIGNPLAFRKGMLLRLTGKSDPSLTFAGRLSESPPVLAVARKDGSVVKLRPLSFAAWNSSSSSAMDSRQQVKLSSGSGSALLLFDIPGDAKSATLSLQVLEKRRPTGDLLLFALDPPGVFYPHEQPPVPGIAATVADEHALKSHPAVIRAGDFDLRRKGVFEGIQQSAHVTREYLPDPLSPGRILYRSMFKQRDGSASGDQNWRGSLSLSIGTMPADLTDPMRPIKGPPTKELFGRLCFRMEEDWLARNDANKMALGWDLRFGYWTKSGYWQQTTGNGGARGTGLKVLRTNKDGTQQWEYQGHSVRMEAGKAPRDAAHPHDALRPITSYTYHLDQFDFNGTGERWGNAVIERGRWHCIEQQIRVNSIVGPFDALGNGQAVADGVLRTWIDGVFVGERTAMRWHRHPDMGIEGPWINWFFGGKQAADQEMHYQMADFVLAREYIGLPKNFALRN